MRSPASWATPRWGRSHCSATRGEVATRRAVASSVPAGAPPLTTMIPPNAVPRMITPSVLPTTTPLPSAAARITGPRVIPIDQRTSRHIRIHAAGALCNPASRAAFGPLLAPVTALVARAVVAEYSGHGAGGGSESASGGWYGHGTGGGLAHGRGLAADSREPVASAGSEPHEASGPPDAGARTEMSVITPVSEPQCPDASISHTGPCPDSSGAGANSTRPGPSPATGGSDLEASNARPDPTEYKYRPALRAALSGCLAHLLALARPQEDAEDLRGTLEAAGALLVRDWLRPLVQARRAAWETTPFVQGAFIN
eukprot:jgi/Mesvir1/24540/Mv21874-RA.1